MHRSNLHHRGAGVLPGSCHVVGALTRGSDLLVVACCQLRSNRRIPSRAHVSYIYGTLAKHQKINLPIRHNQAKSGNQHQSTSININQHQHTNQACFGTFLADLVRCWKALPAVHVEHHRFPHAERQVLHKSKGRGMVWP